MVTVKIVDAYANPYATAIGTGRDRSAKRAMAKAKRALRAARRKINDSGVPIFYQEEIVANGQGYHRYDSGDRFETV